MEFALNEVKLYCVIGRLLTFKYTTYRLSKNLRHSLVYQRHQKPLLWHCICPRE